MSTSVRDLLLIPSDAMTLHGKVLGADATATTYLLNCPPDSDSCERNGQAITLGPWAEKTLASSAEPNRNHGRSHHRATRRPASGPSIIGVKTYKGESDLREIYGPTFEYGRITLTAGLEKLKVEYATTTTAEGTEPVSKETGSSTAGADAPAESNGGSSAVRFSLAAVCAGLFVVIILSG
ncbi:hypothetical protein FAGAP_1199 [Fusarium agapanthi]|uniref:Uncharacterized protein n=1 Tax=Fusarium agapanthi TaxID=1803897 RepID=A0A9P5BIQ7_9HYPO|nr:hypothetical protein FAGAP_1199 [Fusarium agapanthi]